MWVYNTTQGFFLISCYCYTGCSIIIDIHEWIRIYSFVSFILIKASGRVRAASEPQKWSYLSLDMDSFIISKLITEQSKLITKFLD